ncbi:hypothetical protein DFJ43DRAFT_1043217 [Lentinula guzmanii]|uniref:DUF6532 domain-containing protein n=1 Tax=Lentinula guzmanii TaxID=2804957 RepID=A0AA38J9V9_9AGAR|nr:hypothetical protein DFJ43DRAFT_1043217 [Lentinula guzmanii]
MSARAGRKSAIDSGVPASIPLANNEEPNSRELCSQKRKGETRAGIDNRQLVTAQNTAHRPSKRSKQEQNNAIPPTSQRRSARVVTKAPAPARKTLRKAPAHAVKAPAVAKSSLALTPPANEKNRRGRALVIPESEDDEEHVTQRPAPAKDNEENIGEEEEMEMEMEIDIDERQNDRDAGTLFADEVVQVISRGHHDGRKGSCVHDDSPSSIPLYEDDRTSSLTNFSDLDMDLEDGLDEPESAPLPLTRTKKGQKQVEKLAAELPIVSNKILPTRSCATTSTSTNATITVTALEPAWLPRTNIVLEPYTDSTRTFKLSLNGQNSVIKSLINATTKHGYRLESGDHRKYVKPLIRYVSQRISLERKALKSGYSSIILTTFGLDNSPEGIQMALDLVTNSDYIYPAFPYLSAVFFGSSKWAKRIRDKKSTIFVSSIPEKPLELKVPKAMVAMAACVIHAVLLDHAHSKEENFPPTGLYQQWTTFMDILASLEKASSLGYHRFMHKLYLKSSHTIAPATHGLSRDQILKRINLVAFASAQDSDESEEDRDDVAKDAVSTSSSVVADDDSNASSYPS